MKNHGIRKLLGVVLTVLALCLCAPGAAAEGETEGRLCLVVEGGGRLLIAPEYLDWSGDDTVGAVLESSGHTFNGLESGIIYGVNNVAGNFSRSDQDGGYDLSRKASEVSHFRLCELTDAKPSQALMDLMTAMADYKEEEADVRAAAQKAYDKAVNRFVGVSDKEAGELAEDLRLAISDYKETLSGTQYPVTFTGFGSGTYPGISITAENSYGKSWTDTDGDGVLLLPQGDYRFHIRWQGLHVEGELAISGARTVKASFPSGYWLERGSLAVSEAYGEEDFKATQLPVGSWQDRSVELPVPDAFSGVLYTYMRYNNELFATQIPSLTALYTDTAGKQREESLSFESYRIGPDGVLSRGSAENTVTLRLSCPDEQGFTISQDYTLRFVRIPTLSGIQVQDQDAVPQAATMRFQPSQWDYTYKVLDTVKSLTIRPVPLSEDYTLTVNGKSCGAEGVSVDITGETEIPVTVSGGGFESRYTLHVQPGQGRRISFQTASKNVELRVVNSDGLELPYTRMRDTNDYYLYQYILVPGEDYSYVADRDSFYHVSGGFKLEANAGTTLTVDVPAEDWLSNLALGITTAAKNKGTLSYSPAFDPATHSYRMTRPDGESAVALWVDSQESDVKLEVSYDQISSYATYHDVSRTENPVAGDAKGVLLKRFLLADNAYGNTATIRLSKTVNGVKIYQDYELQVERSLSLDDLTAQCSGSPVVLEKPDGGYGFEPEVRSYSLTVPLAGDRLLLSPKVFAETSMNVCADEKGSGTGYRVLVNGEDVTEAGVASIALSGTLDTETVSIEVRSDRNTAATGSYTLTVMKAAPVTVNLDLQPENALLHLTERVSGNRIWPADGKLALSEGFAYDYTLTAVGYVGRGSSLQLLRDEEDVLWLWHGEEKLPVTISTDGESSSADLALSLTPAPVNERINPLVEAQWADFRGTAWSRSGNTLVGNVNALTNNCVSDASIPVTADDGTLYWATKLGEGWGADAVGSPIIVNGDLITYSGNTIYRVDTVTGKVLATGTMDHSSSFSITPPTYYAGMIFVALADGTVQAFNAVTLESLWIYKDSLGGQPNCPITVRDGYLYTGFWVGETAEARFVCLPITDEDPSRGDEAKLAAWYYSRIGGFYWAGAYVGPDYVLVGTDDGKISYTNTGSSLLLLDRRTGKLLDSWDDLSGDIRCSIAYDADTDAFYFVSKGGRFYSVQVSHAGGSWKLTNKWQIALENGVGGTPMSSSSPVVYKGRAYVGVSGIGQFSAYGGHNITVIDLGRRAIAYKVDTQGYPQTSGMLTTAYEAESGSIYVYFFDNYTPGKLRVLRDKAGQNAPDYVVAEGEHMVAYPVFTPTGDQAQYAICSPIMDDFGTVYFKNDSAHLMAYGSQIERLEVTRMPEKTAYIAGEHFDPKGMEVVAYYKNGMFRDVTKYLVWSEEAFEQGETTLTVAFPYVMYHNQENGNEITAGVLTTEPRADIAITVAAAPMPGDVNADGSITDADAQQILNAEAGLAPMPLAAVADVSGDGVVDSNDAVLITQYVQQKITAFPAAKQEQTDDPEEN